jgi:hypothetical protein
MTPSAADPARNVACGADVGLDLTELGLEFVALLGQFGQARLASLVLLTEPL